MGGSNLSGVFPDCTGSAARTGRAVLATGRGDGSSFHLCMYSSTRILIVARLNLGRIAVYVTFKDIKNIHLSVNPPRGRVRISAPSRMRLDTVRVFAIAKLGWIKQQQKKLKEQEREPRREYLDRESHYVWGKQRLADPAKIDFELGAAFASNAGMVARNCGSANATKGGRSS